MKRLGYQPGLDGIRGFAMLTILSFHVFGWPHDGFLALDLFFVLSGFLITTLLLEEWRDRGAISLRAFYGRRALRLLPALFVLILVVVAAEGVLAATGRGDLRQTLVSAGAGLFYVMDFVLARRPNNFPALGHLWSLSVEEQFYFLWPPALLLLLRFRRRWAATVLLVLAAALALRQAQLLHQGVANYRLDFAPDSRGSSIVIGCLAAFLYERRRGKPIGILGLAGAVLIAVLLGLNLGRAVYEGPLVLFGLATALLVLRSTQRETPEFRVLSIPPLVWVGRISYSLYLWHVPILTALGVIVTGRLAAGGLTRQLLGIVLSFAAATVSYYVVERPFLRLKRRLSPRKAQVPIADPPFLASET